MAPTTPIIFLKTASIPKDPYDELFKSISNYNPVFVQVLKHNNVNQDDLKATIISERILPASGDASLEGAENDKYGGLIITSQRAVEALGTVIEELRAASHPRLPLLLANTKIYVVGPATKNALVDLGFRAEHIIGSESGNGANLAEYILMDYKTPRSLLFLVGETRRDVIPRTLLSQTPPIPVRELVVYQTIQNEEFEYELRGALDTLDQVHEVDDQIKGVKDMETRWIVVFSPTGCKGALDAVNERKKLEEHVSYKFCTIGPTTRDHLINECGYQPDSVADTPSPEGILKAIENK